MPEHPTLDQYRETVERRVRSKMADKGAPEAVIYAQQMAMVRQAASYSGIEQWKPEHTVGALFFGSSLRAALELLERAGVMTRSTRAQVEILIDEQENITVQMEPGE